MGNVPDSQADVVRPALPDAIRSPADFAQVIAWFEEVSKPALQEIVAIDEWTLNGHGIRVAEPGWHMVANRLGEEIFAPLRKLVASYAESVPTGEYREGLCLLSIIQLELTYQFARGIFIRDISDKKVPAPGTPVTEDIFERANISLDTVRSFKNQAVLVFRQIATHLRSYYAISTLQARLRAAERTQIQVAGESVRAVVDSLPEGA